MEVRGEEGIRMVSDGAAEEWEGECVEVLAQGVVCCV